MSSSPPGAGGGVLMISQEKEFSETCMGGRVTFFVWNYIPGLPRSHSLPGGSVAGVSVKLNQNWGPGFLFHGVAGSRSASGW